MFEALLMALLSVLQSVQQSNWDAIRFSKCAWKPFNCAEVGGVGLALLEPVRGFQFSYISTLIEPHKHASLMRPSWPRHKYPPVKTAGDNPVA